MTVIDIFYQGEGLTEVDFHQAQNDCCFRELKAALVDKHKLPPDVLIFIEDCDDPVNEELPLKHHAGCSGIKMHIHRCRSIDVSIMFNGRTVHHTFSPSATVARVKRWAAEKKFQMTEAEASEHVLQISGTHERPASNTHIGSLVRFPSCKLSFDLLPDQRING